MRVRVVASTDVAAGWCGTKHVREKKRMETKRNAGEDGDGSVGKKKAAFFDVDGTVTQSNVVVPFVQYKLRKMRWIQKAWYVPYMTLCCVVYLVMDKISRTWFNAVFYRSYRGMPAEEKKHMAQFVHCTYMKPRIFRQAVEMIERLKREGYRIVFVTGSLDFLVEPLAQQLGVDHVLAARMEEEAGRLTGKLLGNPVSDREKAKLVVQYAADHDVDLFRSKAFGDSYADVHMLQAVGEPTVVRGSRKLLRWAGTHRCPCLSYHEHLS
uniref:HAD-IB family hydrolase n=1 Tax=Picocystis salinarum TaxID=88271 RepID=A0A7S3XBC6_9CHLO